MGKQIAMTIGLCALCGVAGYWIGSRESHAIHDRLQDVVDSSQSTEELLAQIMTVFVADLGLRIDGTKVAIFKMPSESGAASAATSAPTSDYKSQYASGAPGVKNPNDDEQFSAPPDGPGPVPDPTPGEKPIPWRELEKDRANVSSEREADEFLKTVRQENLWTTIRNARTIGSDGLATLVGHFQGKLVFFDGNKKPKDVVLDLSVSGQGQGANGKYELIVSQDGNKESDTKGEGSFRHFNGIGEGSAAILVRLTPDSYVQLYTSDRLGQLFGNYYVQESVDKFSPVGTLWLRR